jgi:hypothetical protein
MFRRRTDQVYATLQQVQRRITEQSGTPGAPAVTDSQPATLPNTALHDALGRQPKPQLVGMQPEAPPMPMPMQLPQIPRDGAFLSISKQMTVTLAVFWIACCAVFFVLGTHAGDHRGDNPGEGVAAGAAGERKPVGDDSSASRPLGNSVLIVNSVPSWTQAAQNHFQAEVERLNAVMVNNTARGWKPWFGMRKPVNGELELVFGEIAPGVYGVSQQDYLEFAEELRKAGYSNCRWEVLP